MARIVLMTLYTFSASVETRATVIFLQIETPGLLVPSRLSRRFDKADHSCRTDCARYLDSDWSVASLSCHDPGCSDVSKALEGV